MGKSYWISLERVQQIGELVRIDLSFNVQLFNHHVKLLVVNYAVLVCVDLPKSQRNRFYLLTVLPKDIVQSHVLKLGRRNKTIRSLLRSHPAGHHIDRISLVPTDQQYFLTFVNTDLLRVLSLELSDRCAYRPFCFSYRLHELFLQLVPKHLPESSYLPIVMPVFFYSVHDAHGPLNRNRLQTVLLIEESVHMGLKSLHGHPGVETDSVVLIFTEI